MVAIVAIALSVASTAVAAATMPIAAAAQGPPPNEAGAWLDGLVGGVCFDDAFDAEGSFDFSVPAVVVPCEGPHDNEIVARVPLANDTDLPPDVEVIVADLCAPEYEAFLGRPIEATLMFPFRVWPSEDDWAAGVRDALCVVYAGEPTRGTAASGDLRAPGEMIAAITEVDGQRDIMVVDAGTGSIDLVTGGELSILLAAPTWTRDGASIAFPAKTEAEAEASSVYLIPAVGGPTEVLVTNPGTNDGPALSPDGTRLAYVSDFESDEFEIYVLDIETGGSTRLTTWEDRDSSPQWSPDGSRIAFRRRSDGISSIWVTNADGGDQTRLTDDGGNDYDPRWSPDGGQLLFTTDPAGNFDIWIMAADGSQPQAITTHPGDDEYPRWSGDGRFIVFHSDRHGGQSLWLMRADGSEQSELTGFAPLAYPMFAPAPTD